MAYRSDLCSPAKVLPDTLLEAWVAVLEAGSSERSCAQRVDGEMMGVTEVVTAWAVQVELFRSKLQDLGRQIRVSEKCPPSSLLFNHGGKEVLSSCKELLGITWPSGLMHYRCCMTILVGLL